MTNGRDQDTPVQRAAVFAELPILLAEHGIDPREVFVGSGIDCGALRHDSRVPLSALLACLDYAARRLDCPHLGLLLGQRFTLESHGAMGTLMRTSATLEEALVDFVSWQRSYSNSAVVYLINVADGAALGFGVHVRSSPGTRQLYDAVMSVGCRLIALLTGGKVEPTEVLLSRSRPDEVQPYLRWLTGRVRFDQPQSCLILDDAALTTRLPGQDSLARQQALAALDAEAARFAPNIAVQVARRLKPLLHEGTPKLDAVARLLAMSTRTLRRRLKEEGTSFEGVRDEVRFTLARELLALTDLSIGDISSALAYESHPAFVAAFRRWSGSTPSAWRARQP